jgi:hypothetical protein
MRTKTMTNHRDELIAVSIPLLREIKDKTPSLAVETWLNETYGPHSELYQTIARLIRTGVDEGWAANIEVGGPHYRRSRIAEPSAEIFHFSITAVYLDSIYGQKLDHDEDPTILGQYHGHPYGEFNMNVPLTPGARIRGLNGWCSQGWTAPDPGSHHYPEVVGGALISLFFLPAGRISYDFAEPASGRNDS